MRQAQQDRNVGRRAVGGGGGGDRPLTARSVVASTLLGSRPPELPGRLLVRTGELFGIAEGTVRVALSRMVAAGELVAVPDGRYRLAGHLLGRQRRQDISRRPPAVRWRGGWWMAVVTAEGRRPADRAALRTTMAAHRLAELREGVWTRPDNLGDEARAAAVDDVGDHCTWFSGQPESVDQPTLAASLWDVDGWAAAAVELLGRMAATEDGLARGDVAAIPECFTVAAAALRHLSADPVLPGVLLPPAWPGARLREAYDAYEAALQQTLRAWHRAQR